MKLAVSAIAWSLEDEDEAFELLQSLGIYYIECVPARFLMNPYAYRAKLDSFSLRSVACQALLFGTSNLHLFHSEDVRSRLGAHLKAVADASSIIGTNALVFGSPKNRWIDETTISHQNAFSVAELFFRDLGKYCVNTNTTLCIEPNPVQYGCNFLTNSVDAAEFVKKVASNGIKLNFDLGTSIINSEPPAGFFGDFLDQIGHIHISEPNLAPLNLKGMSAQQHKSLSATLKETNYDGVISIEMSKTQTPDWRESLKRCIEEVRGAYIA